MSKQALGVDFMAKVMVDWSMRPLDQDPLTQPDLLPAADSPLRKLLSEANPMDPGYVYTAYECSLWEKERDAGLVLASMKPWRVDAYRGTAVMPTRICG